MVCLVLQSFFMYLCLFFLYLPALALINKSSHCSKCNMKFSWLRSTLSKEVRTIFKYKKSGLKLKKKNFRLTIVILWSFFRKKNQQLITYNFRLYNRIGISLMILRQKDIRLLFSSFYKMTGCVQFNHLKY